MRAHPETVRNRLEFLGFLVNASALPPKPRLVHERPMRRVHQTNDPVIDVRRQLAGKMRDFVFVAENGKPRRPRNRLRQFRSWRVVDRLAIARTNDRFAAARTHVNPNVAVSLLAWIMP